MKKILVVGAGLAGATVARCLADKGFVVSVIDSRGHIAGNAFDYVDADTGIRIHKYGPHIFHTNNRRVVDWLSNFTDWVNYKHKVKAVLSDGTYCTLPVNRETSALVGTENVIDIFFKPYTEKMWGVGIEELSPDTLNRVPVRNDMNEFYFPDDRYQMMPKNGYTAMVENILHHENITVSLNTSFDKTLESRFFHVFSSQPIDEYYEFQFGALPYRSIKFHNVVLDYPRFLPVPTVNFTNFGKYTRVTEWKSYPGGAIDNVDKTILTYEEPCDYRDNNHERYYPVKDVSGKNREIYEQYKSISNPNLTFIGRCGLYVYLDMHQAVSSSLAAAKKFIENEEL